jgi:hypothetical protein
MPSWDDTLGAQQDENARGMYKLVKLCEGSEDFKDCKTPFQVFCRILELQGEEGAKRALTRFLREINPRFKNPEHWVSQMLPTLQEKDQAKFAELGERAVAASLFQ